MGFALEESLHSHDERQGREQQQGEQQGREQLEGEGGNVDTSPVEMEEF